MKVLRVFRNGFLSHPDNHALLEEIANGHLGPEYYYRQLLLLIYRFLFLMVAEERNIAGPERQEDRLRRIYDQDYSISRLREHVERQHNLSDRHWDFWEGGKQTLRLIIVSLCPVSIDAVADWERAFAESPGNKHLQMRNLLVGENHRKHVLMNLFGFLFV